MGMIVAAAGWVGAAVGRTGAVVGLTGAVVARAGLVGVAGLVLLDHVHVPKTLETKPGGGLRAGSLTIMKPEAMNPHHSITGTAAMNTPLGKNTTVHRPSE